MAADLARIRNRQLLLLGVTLVFTLYEELHLRRVLFARHGGCATIAGSLPNFLAELLLSFAFALVKQATTTHLITRVVVLPAIGLTLYEFAQIWMPERHFDWMDMVANGVGALCAWLALRCTIGSMRTPKA